MSTHDLLDKLDGIQAVNRMDGITVYPESVSRLHRGLGGVNNKVHNELRSFLKDHFYSARYFLANLCKICFLIESMDYL